MIFVVLTISKKFSRIAERNAYINTRQIINQVNTNLDYYLRNMMEISHYLNDIIYNSDITDEELKLKIDVIRKSRKDIVTLALFSEEGDLVISAPTFKLKSTYNITKQDWFKAPIDDPANLFFSSPHVQNIFEGKYSWVVSLSREIEYEKDGETKTGILLVDMNFRDIDDLCQKTALGDQGYVFLIDSNENIVYHPKQQLINIGLKNENIEEIRNHVFGTYMDEVNGEKRLITIDTVNYSRWRIVGVAYMHEIVTTEKDIRNYIIWILIVAIIIAIIISAYISSKISNPIKKLEKTMKIVEKGVFDIKVDVKGETEVTQLARSFSLMITRIKNLMNQIVSEQEDKRKSELDALQAQINPHFLYNTLDSITWMAERGKNDDVVTMVTSLARLFRISISKGKNIITVGEEVEHVRNYLIIQKIRYKNKFEYEIDIDESLKEHLTLKLILQPIVENAIYHGIKNIIDEGFIKVTVSIVEDKLLYEITDNGIGMEEDVIEQIFSEEFNSTNESGVGIKNVHQRIQLYCGKDYGLHIESEVEVGTRVDIYIPMNVSLG